MAATETTAPEDWNDWPEGKAPQWVRELMEKPLSEQQAKMEIAKLRLRVGKLEAYDSALAKRLFRLEVHLGLEELSPEEKRTELGKYLNGERRQS